MNLILIAPPEEGKGTLASMLTSKYGLVSISAGELLRGVDPTTELGKQIREIQSRRELVSDTITNQLMKERLMKDDVKNGFILDGYPRHMPQVEAVERISEELNLKIDYAVYLNVDYETALKRTLGRQICPKCKKTYNRLTGVNAPLKDGICNDCGVELTVRNDDNEETFKNRFNVYLDKTSELLDYYDKLGLLKKIEINNSDSAADTYLKIKKVINSD